MLKSFQSYQKHSEKDSTVLTYFVTEPILKEYFKIDEFYFRDWGKNPSQMDTMELTDTLELTDRDTLCTGRFRTRGWRYVTPLDPRVGPGSSIDPHSWTPEQ